MPASAMTDLANVATLSSTSPGFRPHSPASCCQCVPVLLQFCGTPGTTNRKRDLSVVVEVGPLEGPYQLGDFGALENATFRNDTPSRTSKEPASRMATGSANTYEAHPRYLQSISDHCGQIGRFRDELGKISEPTWHSCLGVAAFCADGQSLGHEWSKGDERYNEAETQSKLSRQGRFGPTTCERFHSQEPEICEACPHFGKIKSPIVLSKETEAVPTNPAGCRTAATPQSGDAELDTEILRLSGLPPALYEHERKAIAEKFAIRTAALDRLVNGVRDNGTDERQGHALQLIEVEPWPEPVDGGELLHDIVREIRRYVVMPENDAITAALWVLHSYVFDVFTCTPRLCITSPEKRCGKTTLLDIIGCLDDQFHETDHGTGNLLADSSFVVDRTRSGIMAGWRQAVALAMTGEEIEALTALSRSRTEPAGRVSRAAMLLGYREKPSFFAVGRRLGVHHQTVQRCVERAMAYGALAALDDRPRPGKEPTITPEAKAWLVSLACDKAKEHGYPHELWTTRLLARHARERGPAAGHQCLARLAQGTVCKLLGQEEIKPHKVRYYLERRDAEFEPKMAEVLCVYREVQVLKKAAAKAEKSKKPVAIVSYDEKPGIQAIATTAPDLPPVPGRHASFARDHEYKRHGTLSLLAGIDLLTGKVHALVRERHRSREFIEFLKLLDAAYPASTAIKLILDNHSAHISRETRAWLDTRPPGRFDFTFTPKHGSWLNLIEGFFSKFARSVLRHIRVTSKHELKQRIIAGIDDVNRHPVIHTWSYKLAEAA